MVAIKKRQNTIVNGPKLFRKIFIVYGEIEPPINPTAIIAKIDFILVDFNLTIF